MQSGALGSGSGEFWAVFDYDEVLSTLRGAAFRGELCDVSTRYMECNVGFGNC
jgi:hypothetical protein